MTQALYAGDPSKWTLYGGDTRLMFTVAYHVDETNHRMQNLDENICVTIYSGGVVVRRLERPMRDFVKRGS